MATNPRRFEGGLEDPDEVEGEAGEGEEEEVEGRPLVRASGIGA